MNGEVGASSQRVVGVPSAQPGPSRSPLKWPRPREGPWRWGQGRRTGHCQAEGAASPRLRLLRGPRPPQRAGLRREPAEAGFLSWFAA